MGFHCIPDSYSDCLVHNAQMARKLSLQNRTKLVDIFTVRGFSFSDSIGNSKPSKPESGNKESGRSYPIRVVRRAEIPDSEAYRDGGAEV